MTMDTPCCCLKKLLQRHIELLVESGISYSDYVKRLNSSKFCNTTDHLDSCPASAGGLDTSSSSSCRCCLIGLSEDNIQRCAIYHMTATGKDFLYQFVKESLLL
jgi:hypothetical protein